MSTPGTIAAMTFGCRKNALRRKATRLAEAIWKNLEALGYGGQKTA